MFRSPPRSNSIAVVGGGPVGLVTAIALAQAGFQVTVFDCATPPIDKACGEGLMPDCLPLLNRLGVSVAGLGHRFQGISFHSDTASVSGAFPTASALGIRRTVLHRLIADRAGSLGVVLRWGTNVARLAPGGISIGDATERFDFVIGADGQNSMIRKQAGLQDARTERKRYGFRKHYRIAPWSPYVEVYWGSRHQLYVSPVARDEICLALISSDPSLRVDSALARCPVLQARLSGAEAASAEKGALTVVRDLRRVHTERVALVGDASGSVDAITGEGLDLGFKQAVALTDALSSGNLAAYGPLHHELSAIPRAMSSLLLSLDKRPVLRRKALRTLERRPEFFASMLGVHVGHTSFSDLVSWGLLGLSREFLVSR